MNVRTVLLVLFTLGFGSTLYAQPYYPQSGAPFGVTQQMEQPGPALILSQGLKKLLAFAGSGRQAGRPQIEAFLEREIVPYFDFAYMARWAAGERMWQRMGEQRQAELEAHIKQDFLATLATRLTAFGDQQVRLSRTRSLSANEVVVSVTILNPQAYPAKLNFRFYRAPEGWKVFDVSANGNSAVMHYRNQFRRMMRQRMHYPRGYHR